MMNMLQSCLLFFILHSLLRGLLDIAAAAAAAVKIKNNTHKEQRCGLKERMVSMAVKKKGLREGRTIPTITYEGETWVWNERQGSRIQSE